MGHLLWILCFSASCCAIILGKITPLLQGSPGKSGHTLRRRVQSFTRLKLERLVMTSADEKDITIDYSYPPVLKPGNGKPTMTFNCHVWWPAGNHLNIIAVESLRWLRCQSHGCRCSFWTFNIAVSRMEAMVHLYPLMLNLHKHSNMVTWWFSSSHWYPGSPVRAPHLHIYEDSNLRIGNMLSITTRQHKEFWAYYQFLMLPSPTGDWWWLMVND